MKPEVSEIAHMMLPIKVQIPTLVSYFLIISMVRSDEATNQTFKLDDGRLYDCLFGIFPPTPENVVVSMYHLLLDESIVEESINKTEPIEVNHSTTRLGDKVMTLNSVSLENINANATVDQLKKSRLDPNLPFLFFVNGFNNDGVFEASWMYDLASVFVRYHLDKGHEVAANVIFISWYIKDISAANPLMTYIAYLRSMANYEHVLDIIVTGLTNLIDYVEDSGDRWRGEEFSRSDYYSKFTLYGHSLGAHLVADAVMRINKVKPSFKFGRVIGLDPARICFQGNYGISAVQLMKFVSRVVVIHSNAGVTGVASTGGHVEILLNGGSFQPDCRVTDLLCHHARSHQILRYTDDECMMVAYKCERSEQFNAGACHLCEDGNQDYLSENPNCILVNLSEQHTMINDIDPRNRMHMKRRMAQDDAVSDERIYPTKEENDSSQSSWLPISILNRQEKPKKKKQYHFVNTNPEYPKYNNSHCLQHYQMRLLTMTDDKSWLEKCPLKSYLTGDAIQVNLFEEIRPELVFDQSLNNSFDKLVDQLGLYSKLLTTIVPDTLHTGLLNFPGKQKLFVSASLDGINLGKWSRCMIKNKMANHLELVLDVAFMSSTQQSARNSLSSILCGYWAPVKDADDQNGELVLELCRQSELRNISSQVDDILKDIRFRHKRDTWQVLLLDSLFSFFTELDPFNE